MLLVISLCVTPVRADTVRWVDFDVELLEKLPEDKRDAAIGVLSHDPRPSYKKDSDRVYGLTFAGHDIRFRVKEDILTVLEVDKSPL